MSASIRGMDLSASLPEEDGVPPPKKREEEKDNDDDGEEEEEEEGESDDDMFSAPNPFTAKAEAPKKPPQGDDTHGLFIPDSVVRIAPSDDMPVPNHSEAQLPPGTSVWVWHPEDVYMLGSDWWTEDMLPHTGGEAEGKVVRHSGNGVLVAFDPIDAIPVPHTLTFPRAVLSKVPLEPKKREKKFNVKDQPLPFASIMGPKANTKKVKQTDAVSHMIPSVKATDEDKTAVKITDLTRDVWNMLNEGELSEAVDLLSAIKSTKTKEEDLELIATKLVVLVLQEKPKEAMQIAQPFLSAAKDDEQIPFMQTWRACAASGNYKDAANLVTRAGASKKVPKEVVERLDHLHSIFGRYESFLTQKSIPLKLVVDHGLARRFVATKKFAEGDVICSVNDCLITAIPDCCSTSLTCTLCHKILKFENSTPCPHGTGFRFCNSECADAAWLKYLEVESTSPLRQAFRSMSGAIRVAESIVDDSLRNAAFLTIRIFSSAITHVKNSTELFPITLTDALINLGVYPFPTSINVHEKLLGQVDLLFGSLEAVVGPELKRQLTRDVFRGVFRAVYAYGRVIKSSDCCVLSTVTSVMKRPTSANGAGLGGARPHSRSGRGKNSAEAAMQSSSGPTTSRSATSTPHERRSPNSSVNLNSSPIVAAPKEVDLYVITRLSDIVAYTEATRAGTAALSIGEDGRMELRALVAIEEGAFVHI